MNRNALDVLVALSESETHGYGLLKRIRRDGPGGSLSASTLYSVVARLERAGLIEESDWRPDTALDDERRRYYRLTDAGIAARDAEVDRLDAFVRSAKRLRAAGDAGT